MKLLVVTDHRFQGSPEGVFDTYCFDRAFFEDYRRVFEEVVVAARVGRTGVSVGARRADGDGVSFMGLPDLRGSQWVLKARSMIRGELLSQIRSADAVCLRIPSFSGVHAFALSQRAGKPVMFELLGDPSATLGLREYGFAKWAFGQLQVAQTRRIVRAAVAGSYVSYRHLQERFPAGPQTVRDSISSIRLDPAELRSARSYSSGESAVKLVLVASLVPVKCHAMLLQSVAQARSAGAALELHLIGDGELRPELERLTQALELLEVVRFHGHLSERERLREVLDSSDLFVMTSASEGMPRAMIEAMARGLPALGTAVGGIAELLPREQLVAAGDCSALAERLVQVSVDRQRMSRWSEHSIDTARRFLAPELSQKRVRLLQHLREAAEKSPGARVTERPAVLEG